MASYLSKISKVEDLQTQLDATLNHIKDLEYQLQQPFTHNNLDKEDLKFNIADLKEENKKIQAQIKKLRKKIRKAIKKIKKSKKIRS